MLIFNVNNIFSFKVIVHITFYSWFILFGEEIIDDLKCYIILKTRTFILIISPNNDCQHLYNHYDYLWHLMLDLWKDNSSIL